MIVIFGSTGFTGRLVTRYFAKHVSKRFPDLEWCIAGRNREKLEMLRESLESKTRPSIRVGDGTNAEDAKRIVADASVVISTAGPFLDYSKEIVNACVHSGSHYVDITGETPFVRDMLDRGHHDRARKNGIYIVPGCGFDSVPSDIGCYAVVRRIKELTGGAGANVVYDPIGDAYSEPCIRATAWDGRYLVIGFAAGQIPKIPINLALLKGMKIVGVFWGAWVGMFPEENKKNFEELFRLHADGKINPEVSDSFSLDDGANAIAHLKDRKAKGKVIIKI